MQVPSITDDVLLASIRNRPKLQSSLANSKKPRQLAPLDNKSSQDKLEAEIWSRFGRTDLSKEVHNQFGGQARVITLQNYVEESPEDQQLIQQILTTRNKERFRNVDQNEQHLRDLIAQRDRLLDERQQIETRRRHVVAPPSPTFPFIERSKSETLPWDSDDRFLPERRLASAHSVHAVDSFIKYTNDKLPAELAKYQRLKDAVEKDLLRLGRPYDGELGPHSYEDWQMPAYHLVRGLVDDLVDKFLDVTFLELPPALNRETAKAVMEADHKLFLQQQKALSEAKAVQLIMEEIILEGTSNGCLEAAQDFLETDKYLQNRTNIDFMKAAEVIATDNDDGREDSDPAFSLVTRTFFNLHNDRQRIKSDVWSHAQHLHLRSSEVDMDQTPADDDVQLLCFHNIVPMDLRQHTPRKSDSQVERARKEGFVRFSKAEVQYWKGFLYQQDNIAIASKCQGVYSTAISPSRRAVAFGTVHGDLLVYSMEVIPFRPIRAIHNQDSKTNDTVIDISWSLDNQQLVSINQMGVLQVWSMKGGGVNREDIKGLELAYDNLKIGPEQLTHQVSLDVDKLDLTFQTGPLAEMDIHKENYGPTLAAFFPSITLLGSQSSVCVALDNGDLLRCDFEEMLLGPLEKDKDSNGQDQSSPTQPTYDDMQFDDEDLEVPKLNLPKVYPPDGQLSTIGQDIPAEVFRQHIHPIIHLGFIDNLDHMVTVDQKAFINIWRYMPNQLSNYGWFIPYRRFRLDMTKKMYSPTDNTRPNIIFTDSRKQGGSHQRTLKVIAHERQEAERKIEDLDLKDPWHEEIITDQKLLSRVYAPEGPVLDSGSLFHIIIRHQDTGALSTYLSRVYKPLLVKASRLLSCKQDSLGKKLHFVLLFPAFPPKDAHLTVVTFDLHDLDLVDFRLDIPIEDEGLYNVCSNDNVVSCEVSLPLGVTGSDYLFLCVNGELSAYSLLTGAKVLTLGGPKLSPGFGGLVLSPKMIDFAPTSQLSVTDCNNKYYVMAYTSDQRQKSKHLNQITVLELKDRNNSDSRASMAKATQLWKDHPAMPPVDQRMNNTDYSTENNHPAAFMHQIMTEILEGVVGRSQEVQGVTAEDRVRFYQNLLPETLKQDLTQGSRMDSMPPSASRSNTHMTPTSRK